VFISDSTETDYVLQGEITVGDDSDVSKNPPCGVNLDGGGLYECNGVAGHRGLYIGIVQTGTIQDNFFLC